MSSHTPIIHQINLSSGDTVSCLSVSVSLSSKHLQFCKPSRSIFQHPRFVANGNWLPRSSAVWPWHLLSTASFSSLPTTCHNGSHCLRVEQQQQLTFCLNNKLPISFSSLDHSVKLSTVHSSAEYVHFSFQYGETLSLAGTVTTAFSFSWNQCTTCNIVVFYCWNSPYQHCKRCTLLFNQRKAGFSAHIPQVVLKC